jgi:hypothetical protein
MLPTKMKSLLRLPVSESESAWFHAAPKGENEFRLRRIPIDPREPCVDRTPEQAYRNHPGWKQYALRDVERITGLRVGDTSIDEPGTWSHIVLLMEQYILFRGAIPPDDPIVVTVR